MSREMGDEISLPLDDSALACFRAGGQLRHVVGDEVSGLVEWLLVGHVRHQLADPHPLGLLGGDRGGDLREVGLGEPEAVETPERGEGGGVEGGRRAALTRTMQAMRSKTPARPSSRVPRRPPAACQIPR